MRNRRDSSDAEPSPPSSPNFVNEEEIPSSITVSTMTMSGNANCFVILTVSFMFAHVSDCCCFCTALQCTFLISPIICFIYVIYLSILLMLILTLISKLMLQLFILWKIIDWFVHDIFHIEKSAFIDRGYYTVARRYEYFIFSWWKQYFTHFYSQILFSPGENKIHIFKPLCNFLFII